MKTTLVIKEAVTGISVEISSAEMVVISDMSAAISELVDDLTKRGGSRIMITEAQANKLVFFLSKFTNGALSIKEVEEEVFGPAKVALKNMQ